MKVFRGVSSVEPAMRGAVLTVGNFDGVHLGHHRILRTVKALAKQIGVATIGMTFEPHPLSIIRPENAPARLTPWEEKRRQFEASGIDAVVLLEAKPEILSLTATDFVNEILVRHIRPSYIVEGTDFGFGKGRLGTLETLFSMGPAGGFRVHVVDPHRLSLDGKKHIVVSSTLVRECLRRGCVEDAALCLGRPYSLIGTVVSGAGAGRHLGYPTINLEVGEQITPAEGVYAGIVKVGGSCAVAAVSIGHRPTLGGGAVVVEAFVLGRSDNWYGQMARLDLVARIRDQATFETREQLAEQITRDVEAIRRLPTVTNPQPSWTP